MSLTYTGTLILIIALLPCAFGSTALSLDQDTTKPAPRPNILLILCDDLGYSDIGCYGGEIETPHLDRLATEGMRFRQFYNNAKCTTTRASIITGQYPRRKGGLLRADMRTLGEVMLAAGYRTALSGKWHLGKTQSTHPFQRGFERFYGLLDGCCNFFDPSQRDPGYKGGRIRSFGEDDRLITDFPEDFYTTDAFTDHAIQCVKDFAEDNAPFFLHLCFTAPHYPLHALPQDIAKYRGTYKAGWDVLRGQRFERMKQLGIIDERYRLTPTDSRSYDWKNANHEWEDLRMAVYAAMVDRVDQNIGRLMQALKDSGQAENTLTIFLSDNGGCAEEPGGRAKAGEIPQRTPGPKDDYTAVGPAWGWAQNAPFKRYKSWCHEGGIKKPCIAHWPAHIEAKSFSDQVGHIIDFMPTFVALGGASGEPSLPAMEGQSLLPQLTGSSAQGRSELCWEWAGSRAIRQLDEKLVWDKTRKQWELYDLRVDPSESNDLAAKRPERVDELAAAWKIWATKTGL
ncbi:MAG: arylsulfatase A-like enzyme [Planctomycetota bacterium]|jgi:arylsulfatase A-like enzyme